MAQLLMRKSQIVPRNSKHFYKIKNELLFSCHILKLSSSLSDIKSNVGPGMVARFCNPAT